MINALNQKLDVRTVLTMNYESIIDYNRNKKRKSNFRSGGKLKYRVVVSHWVSHCFVSCSLLFTLNLKANDFKNIWFLNHNYKNQLNLKTNFIQSTI